MACVVAAVADLAKARETFGCGDFVSPYKREPFVSVRRSKTRRRGGAVFILTLGGANRKVPNEIFSKNVVAKKRKGAKRRKNKKRREKRKTRKAQRNARERR